MAASAPDRISIRRNLIAGTALALALTLGLGGWAATTDVAGAVVASGQLVVDSNLKKVQHPNGGVVAHLAVSEGALVRAGDVLVRLDDTVARANAAIVAKMTDDLAARRARLEAERDGSEAIRFPPDLAARATDEEVAATLASEVRLFASRRAARAGQKAQLTERIAQLGDEIRGHVALQEAKADEIALIARELEGVRDLFERKLVPLARMTALEREAARLKGERAQSIAAAAQARGRISEIELQILQIDQELSSEVARDLREIEAKMGELRERRVAAEDQLRRIDIRAPQDGKVHQLAVHTVGGVINAGEPIMLIVPQTETLAVEARVPPQQIEQVHLGQRAGLRFSAFNQRTTPEIFGAVDRISGDVTVDPRSGASFYTVRIALPEAELARLDAAKLVPGMPVEVFAKTDERTVLSYFTKPLRDQIARAFRER
ncbi:HlyD family type I secretion periplasmic adaptor subunit [Rhabdaerophilum calidifontis]|uniref:HlyD family type I secretion periplasmic adaptor subunit n=1 Tax=Rhabdaerophilum calidifontis TaxID=2604328 RepID=UPI00123AD939|nr:HlyD family type I secretion periplasmic adaptor subunit [Rhabdaerophilum calidifontis]